MPTVLIAPLRDTAILAKQAATIDALSGGRLSIGVGVGVRDDDYRATGRPFHQRGRRLNQQLDDLKGIWSGGDINGVGPIGPNPAQEGGLPLFIGGYGEEMARRVARWGNGYISGSGGPERAGSAYKLAEAAWQRANRSGRPRFVACSYFALGEGAEEQVRTAIGAYYGERGRGIIGLTPTTEQGVRDVIAQFRDIGADELILWPAGGNVEQVDRLAQLAG